MGKNTHLLMNDTEDTLPQTKRPAEMKHFKPARDRFTTAKAVTMLIGLALGGIIGARLGMDANLAGAAIGSLLGAAAGVTAGTSIWY